MAFMALSLASWIALSTLTLILGSESRLFPLDGCFTEEFDILGLMHGTMENTFFEEQNIHFQSLIIHIINSPHHTIRPRVMTAYVNDMFSFEDPDVNVSSWLFNESLPPHPYGIIKRFRNWLNVSLLRNILELKMAFVQRLFSEMTGVRYNATKIAIVFLDGSKLLNSESNTISNILQQQDTGIKIFVVVLRYIYSNENIYLNNTLLLSYYQRQMSPNILPLVICNQCTNGWFMFEQTRGINLLSCYRFVDSTSEKMTWNLAASICTTKYYGFLATLETQEELDFVQTRLFEFVKDSSTSYQTIHVSSKLSADVFIGLNRDKNSYAHRFHWLLNRHEQYRPLVVNNWMPGRPSDGVSRECGVWQFFWNNSNNETNLSSNGDHFVQGWADVQCNVPLTTFALCEFVSPLSLNTIIPMRIAPASNDSLKNALSKSDVINYGDNIVSVSAHMAYSDFIIFLKKIGLEFPMINCFEFTHFTHYISYIYICDIIRHCNNFLQSSACIFPPVDVWQFKNIYATCNYIKNREYFSDKAICNVNCTNHKLCDGYLLQMEYSNGADIDCTCMSYVKKGDVIPLYDYLLCFTQKDENEKINYDKELTNTDKSCDLHSRRYNYDWYVPCTKHNDGRTICTDSEEIKDETIRNKETTNECNKLLDDFTWAPRCVYVTDSYGGLLGCRDLSHLNNCSDFVCPEGYFKCISSYCIPQHYVFNGKADCPTGEDEYHEIISPCSGNFVCFGSFGCLHPDRVCDGNPDCEYKDDEVDCDVSCAEGFLCVAGTVTVSGYNKSIPLKTLDFLGKRTTYLDLSGVDLSEVRTDTSFANSNKLSKSDVIIWSNCNISNLSEMLPNYKLLTTNLDVSYNCISHINANDCINNVFSELTKLNMSHNTELATVKNMKLSLLHTLDLSHTHLSNLDESFVTKLRKLQHLNLSHTFISDIYKQVLLSNLHLQTLDLRGVVFIEFYEYLFNNLTISQHIYGDYFEICCPQVRGTSIPSHMCHAPEITIASCFDLLGNNVQRVLLWVIAILAVAGNMSVIVYRVTWDRSVVSTGYGLFVTNLGISDFILGVYMFIIAGADYYYRGMFVFHITNWRKSVVCRFAGFLATLSIETSSFFIFLITLDRFLVMKFPFGQIQFSTRNKIIVVLVSWTAGSLIALIPVVFKFEIYTSNVMCLGLPLTTKPLSGWEYSFGVFVVLNFLMSLVVAVGQIGIFKAMSENRVPTSVTSTSSHRSQDIVVAKQLALIAMFNFVCWFPIGVMGLMSLAGREISNDAYAWTMVFVLRINSAANPILYTIPALMDKWEKFKSGNRRST